MKKWMFLMALTMVFCCFGVAVSAAEATPSVGALSPAISVMQRSYSVIKTGVGQNSVQFSEADFSVVSGEVSYAAIEITSLPDVAAGVLKLGAVDVTPGQIIPREALPALRFLPGNTGVRTASFGFRPCGDLYEEAFACEVYLLDALNFAPTASGGAFSAVESVATMFSLTAEDPEGDEMLYQIVSAPKKGRVKLMDAKNGVVRYLAAENAAGEDSFTYVAVDRYGNVSASAMVSVTLLPNEAGFVYADLQNEPLQTPAVVLAAENILVGEAIGDVHLFYPEKEVSRADFLMMAMKLAEIPAKAVDTKVSAFVDRDEFSPAQAPYILTAEKAGIVFGIETEMGRGFFADQTITAGQAATILGRIAAQTGKSGEGLVPVSVGSTEEIGDAGYALLCAAGIGLPEDRVSLLTRADAVMLLYSLRKSS